MTKKRKPKPETFSSPSPRKVRTIRASDDEWAAIIHNAKRANYSDPSDFLRTIGTTWVFGTPDVRGEIFAKQAADAIDRLEPLLVELARLRDKIHATIAE